MYWKTSLGIETDEPGLPLAHLLASPALHATLIQRECRIGYDQAFVYAHNLAETLALGACTQGGVEGKELVGGFLKHYAVGLEARVELVQYAGRQESEHHLASALVEGRLHAVGKTGKGVVVIAHRQAVDDQMHLTGSCATFRGKVFFYGGYLSVHLYADEALLQILLQAFAHVCRAVLLTKMHGGKHHKARTRGVRLHASDDVLHTLLLHLLATHRTVGTPHSGKEHAHVLVYLGAGAHGGARIAAAHLLLYGYGRGDALNEVAFGLAHTSEELTGITGKAFHIAALTFGIQCVEGKA